MTSEPRVDLMYPRNDDGVSTVKVGLIDVRAADDLTIRYDFERDGYAITREVTRDGDGFMEGTGEWREVAFIPAWTEAAESLPTLPRRLRSCVEQWPECEPDAYNPACCRFPKSCSCLPGRDVPEEWLEDPR